LLFIGYALIGLNYSLTLALFGMIMNVVPFIGPFIAVIPALIVGAVQDWVMVVWVSLITLIAQQLESNFISPTVMGRKLAIHPYASSSLIVAAGSIATFLRIFFSVSFSAVIRTLIHHCYPTYR